MIELNRNDRCWCGSGKKLKKCHLEMTESLLNLVRDGYSAPSLSLIKSKENITGIKKSSKLTKKILDYLETYIKPGITTNQINDVVHNMTIGGKAVPAPLNYRGFPKSTCTSINEVVCHGIPSDRELKEGDIINVDVTCKLDGYYGDSCRMYDVGKITDSAKQLSLYTKECLDKGIAVVKPLATTNDIGNAIHDHADKKGYGVVDMFIGHGVGNEFHEDPHVFHCRRLEKGMVLLPNMVFTIEPMINEGTHKVKVLKDKWTAVTQDGKLSAQWEHTVLVTETGVEILT